MLGCAGGVRGSEGSGTGAGASTISNVRTAAARLSSISRNASPSGCTASYAANATSGSEARNTPSIPPSRTPGIASASTASPAAPARIAPAPAPAPRIDARARRSPSIARDHPVRSSPSLPSCPNAVRSARPDRSLVNPACSSARAAIDRSDGRRARRRVASGTASPPIARNASRTRASAGSNAARIAHANATARIGGHRRHETADEERVERVDVGDRPREQVAAAEPAEPAGRERFDRAEQPHADLGQDPEGREVHDVPLRVAQPHARDRERADRRHGHARAPRTP